MAKNPRRMRGRPSVRLVGTPRHTERLSVNAENSERPLDSGEDKGTVPEPTCIRSAG